MKIADYKPDTSFYLKTAESLENEQQKRSYKYIINEVDSGRFVDIGDNDYLDIYLHQLNRQLKESIVNKDNNLANGLVKTFEFIINHYKSTHTETVGRYYPSYIFTLLSLGKNIVSALDNWLEFMSEYESNYYHGDIVISLFTTFKEINAQDYVDPKYFSILMDVDTQKFLTNFGKNHHEDIDAIIGDLLNRDYQLSNTNFVHKMYEFEDGQIYIVDHVGTVGGEALFNLNIITDARKTEYDEGIYKVNVQVPVYTPIVRRSYIKSIAREAEAILRQETGVEHRWVSESVLFRQIQSAFSDQRVQQHASPSFLGRQHYDVYMPELKIALEYQGDQHFRPIEFFGGEAGFIETQKRDKRKRKLSEDNGIYQLDVLPGYGIASVLQKILQHNDVREYDLDELVHSARTLNRDTTDSLESRESVVTRINLDREITTRADVELDEIINKLIQEASNTKIGQRELTTDGILRYQGLCSKYMKSGEIDKELQVRIMMYARGVKSFSFDAYWREKEIIKMIGVENFNNS